MADTMICLVLLFVSLFKFVSAVQINVTAGQNVSLPCQAPNSNIIVVEWSRPDLKTEYVLLYRDEQFLADNQHPSFKNRVDLQDRQMKDGDVSLILKKVSTADAGTYECHVKAGTNRRKRANLDCDPISIIYLRVDPPGPTGGTTEDGGEEDEAVGLIVGVSVPAVLLVAAVFGILIYKKLKQQKQDMSVSDTVEQSPKLVSPETTD